MICFAAFSIETLKSIYWHLIFTNSRNSHVNTLWKFFSVTVKTLSIIVYYLEGNTRRSSPSFIFQGRHTQMFLISSSKQLIKYINKKIQVLTRWIILYCINFEFHWTSCLWSTLNPKKYFSEISRNCGASISFRITRNVFSVLHS